MDWFKHAFVAVVLGVGAVGLAAADTARPRESTCAQRAEAPGRAGDFVSAVARESLAVVRVLASGTEEWNVGAAPSEDVPSRGIPVQWTSPPDRSLASGFVIDQEGYILTAAHAVAGAQDMTVVLPDERRFRPALVGLDRRTDIAVLKIAASRLPAALIGSGSGPCAGEWVAAMGAPFGFENSVAAGVVSANPRFVPGGAGVPFIQTDVALSPGSSGGPLFNLRGEVVGVNSMIYSTGGYGGASFSLPIDLAMRVAAELRSTGRVHRGQIGAASQALTPELAPAFGLDRALGALVIRVEPQGGAAYAGLRSGDVILAIDGAAWMSYPDIQERVAAARPGTELALAIWRNRALVQLKVRVAEAVEDLPRPAAVTQSDNDARLGLALVERGTGQSLGMLPAGIYVRSASGFARLAGLRFDDMIVGVNGTAVASLKDFDSALQATQDDDVVALLVRRGKLTNFVPVLRRPPKT
ncbi:trypsin-like peptidase domain-containing protein [Variovorax sp. PBL-E5]|uniref:trypsin-like peptidase domain-containing protein n=1 Tax=Variovorax sp. PBL-E5 TaxID=434014 RepID=UPI001317F488|nr:trypsin-like peptidase domain-containing protein [Variovorax sp. PBL-E5]VTU22229.1 putative periplasmic serine endoprotease DegP-like precursor [Variovorax sp. PBL-E5]